MTEWGKFANSSILSNKYMDTMLFLGKFTYLMYAYTVYAPPVANEGDKFQSYFIDII